MLFYQPKVVETLCLDYGTCLSGLKQASRALTGSYRHPILYLSKKYCFVKVEDLYLNLAFIDSIEPKEKGWLVHTRDQNNLLIECSFNLLRAWARFCVLKQLL